MRQSLAAGLRIFDGPLGVVAIVTLAAGAGLVTMLLSASAGMNSTVVGPLVTVAALASLIAVYAFDARVTRRKKAGR